MRTQNCTVQRNKWAPIYILHSTLCTLHCIPFLIVLLPPRDVQFIMSVNFRVYVTPLQTLQIAAASVRLPLNVLRRQQLCQFPLQGIPTSFSHSHKPHQTILEPQFIPIYSFPNLPPPLHPPSYTPLPQSTQNK